jgi:hypothetical protein
MELDEMKNAWLALDRRLERQETLNLRAFRDNRLDGLRASLRPLVIGRIAQIAIGAMLAHAVAPFWIGHLDTPHFVVIGASLHLYALMMIVGGARDLYLVSRIDYAAPVVDIQARLIELRAWLVRSAPVFGAVGCFVWVPFVLWAFEVAFGVDVWRHAPGVVWIFLASSVFALALMLLAIGWMRRSGGSKWVERIERSAIGSSVSRAQRFLDEMAAFTREA